MITPIRGRKRSLERCDIHAGRIRNDNPDKGTEAISSDVRNGKYLIRNDNPDKGTEAELSQ